MRLTVEYQNTIRNTVKDIFGVKSTVFLFGSRTDDALKGGDIDLLVQSSSIIDQRQQKRLQLIASLQIQLGDQPIDVVIVDPGVDKKAIHNEAMRTGIEL